MFESVSSVDKVYVSYPDGYHELFTEPDGIGAAAREQLVSWVLERAGAAAKL